MPNLLRSRDKVNPTGPAPIIRTGENGIGEFRVVVERCRLRKYLLSIDS